MSEEKSEQIILPDIKEVVRLTMKNREDYFYCHCYAPERAQSVLSVLFFDRQPTKDEIIQTIAFVLRIYETPKGYFQLPNQIKKAVEDAEKSKPEDRTPTKHS